MQEKDSSEKISIGGDPNRDIGKDGREYEKVHRVDAYGEKNCALNGY